jgi:DNA-binding response OmpR family regulator
MPKVDRGFRPRVLVLEDEGLIGFDLALTLQAQGYEVLGPCRRVSEAEEAIGTLHPDVAVLDINLDDARDGFEMADKLRAADIPFVFVTGYSEAVMPTPTRLARSRRLSKPVDTAALVRSIEALIDA